MSSPPKTVVPSNDNVAHALAGAGGGILSMILTYPLITLSTRAQVESRRAESAFLTAVRNIVAREGISGLYSGLNSALFGISVTNFVYYYWYEWTRAFFEAAAGRAGRPSRKLTTLEAMAAGAIAGSVTVIVTNPIWVINTRMTTRKQVQPQPARPVEKTQDLDLDDRHDQQEDQHQYQHQQQQSVGGDEESVIVVSSSSSPSSAERAITDPALIEKQLQHQHDQDRRQQHQSRPGTVGTLLALLRNEGPQALFAGVIPALVLVINPILQYTLFEQLKNSIERRHHRVTPVVAFLLGALGKLFATTITYPYITVKSQMHVAGQAGQAGDKKEGMVAAIRRLVREEGYAGLYKGLGPKVTQSVLTAALLFAFKDVLYEQTVRLRMAAAARRRLVA